MTENNNRVCCLYRVSTDKQVDFNSNHEADLPMQRKACHKFAESKGWVIVHEEQEEGVSGHKVRAAARDKLQIIKDYARRGKFDILLVFMFDRIGRIADETPFVVEWFVRNGIRVWSTQEGEQRFDNHTDKLLNYIRFWQADGESEKTSVRTRTSLRQLVEEGHFKGGNAPYGYDLVRSGRINKRKHELYELHINEQEAAVVRIVFDKYVYEGYGPQHIATYLNNSGYRARSGKCWHPSSIRGMVQNLTYTGVLRCGDARSELMPDLQIVPQEQFENAQRIRNERSVRSTAEAENRLPLNIHGKSLLAGNAYCGHCGAKLELTSSRKWRKMADGSLDDTLRIRYTCYGKLRKQTNCTGQTGYTVHILDEIIDKAVRQIFSKMRGIPKEQIVTKRYEKETTERKNHLQDLQTQRDKAEKDLLSLKAEILACIKGESVLPRETLAEMITEQEEKLKELEDLCESASEELERTAELMDKVSRLYDELISYADLYDSANFEAKKMIEGLTNVFEAAENAANSARKSAKEFAEKYKDAPVVYVMSSGASMEVAYSTSICLMMEMQWVNSGSFHSGEFFHGPFEIVDKDVPFILLMNDGKTRPVDARALTFLHRFDALTTVVDAKDYGLGNAVDSSVITYFNPLMHTAVFRVYAEELSYVRQHPLTLRRYMWKLEY
ncbi:recombinase family protein [Faecalibacterium prausnitzii]|uniref:recombinase family protein n=1 Tax=Faecalibacterium prausnitzii TaxID=853 RepID=UPI0021DAB9D5|nr:recombinase family protein [Faecalibacterium prausnitzii]